MINDPIVNAIRQIRQAYAAKFDNDLHAICEDLRRQERESGREFQALVPRKEELPAREPTNGKGCEEPFPGKKS
jgi:hypothetical protein